MLDGFAVDDLNKLVIRALHSPRTACVAPSAGRHDGPELWGVMMGTATSSGESLLSVTYGAWTGDIPLVPTGAVSDEAIARIRLSAWTRRATIG